MTFGVFSQYYTVLRCNVTWTRANNRKVNTSKNTTVLLRDIMLSTALTHQVCNKPCETRFPLRHSSLSQSLSWRHYPIVRVYMFELWECFFLFIWRTFNFFLPMTKIRGSYSTVPYLVVILTGNCFRTSHNRLVFFQNLNFSNFTWLAFRNLLVTDCLIFLRPYCFVIVRSDLCV